MALFNKDSSLTHYLSNRLVPTSSFSPNTSVKTPVLVTNYNFEEQTDNPTFKALFEFIKGGGTAFYLADQETGKVETSHPAFPFSATIHPAVGLWTCMAHLVHEHPFFEGLPTGGPMRDVYENVWPTRTLRDLQLDNAQSFLPIVGTVAFDWFSKEHKMQYSGPGASWWGAELLEIPIGEGQLIISQLRLLDQLGKDPVADKIFSNMLK